MNLFNARDILAASFRNQRSKRIPFTAGQVFGLTINEDLSPACLIGPIDSAGATAVLNPPAVASQDLENANG